MRSSSLLAPGKTAKINLKPTFLNRQSQTIIGTNHHHHTIAAAAALMLQKIFTFLVSFLPHNFCQSDMMIDTCLAIRLFHSSIHLVRVRGCGCQPSEYHNIITLSQLLFFAPFAGIYKMDFFDSGFIVAD